MRLYFLIFVYLLFHLFAHSQTIPVIASFSPASGPIGTTVTISGNNFSSVASDNIVRFGTVKASVLNAGPGSLTVTAPAGATYQPITVTVNGLTAYSKQPFVLTFNGGSSINSNTLAPPIYFTIDSNYMRNIIAGDLDDDGKVDLILHRSGSPIIPPAIPGKKDSVDILRNTSTGNNISFAPKLSLTTSGNAVGDASFRFVTLGDMDGDGKLDLLAISGNKVYIFRNTSVPGTISFTAPVILTSTENYIYYSIAVTDIEGDGKPDIGVTRAAMHNAFFRNTSVGANISFSGELAYDISIFYSSGTSGLLTEGSFADFDGDGKDDFISFEELKDSAYVLRNISIPGFIIFSTPGTFAVGIGNKGGMSIGDIDMDGKTDVEIVGRNKISIFKNSSSPGAVIFNNRVDYSTNDSTCNHHNVGLGDLNGDSKVDIITSHDCSDSSFFVSENITSMGVIDNTSLAQNLCYPAYPSMTQVTVADINNDGLNDVLTISADHTFCIFLNQSLVTGINDPVNNNDFIHVYPNPANDKCNVHIASQYATEKLFCKVFDSHGQMLFMRMLRGADNSLDVHAFSAGIYFVTIFDSDKRRFYICKIIKL